MIAVSSGSTIRKYRAKKKLVLRDISTELGIDIAILSKIERGERRATKDQILKLADILEIDKESILVQYLSERILYEIKDEDLGIKALKVAERKIKREIKTTK